MTRVTNAPLMIPGAAQTFTQSVDTTGQAIIAADDDRYGIAFIRNHGGSNAALIGEDEAGAVISLAINAAGGAGLVNGVYWLGRGQLWAKSAAATTTVTGWYV